jgi:hypothetical protein
LLGCFGALVSFFFSFGVCSKGRRIGERQVG